MHLALVINSLGIGGAERVLVRLAEIWANKGHKVSFIIFFEDQTNSYILAKHNNINLINLGETKPLANINYLINFFKIIKRIYLLTKLFKKLKPDLIISFLVGVNITVLLANFWLKRPIIVSERIDPASHIIPSIYKKLRLITYRFANTIVVQTKKIKEYFPINLQSKIVIIPNWIKQPEIIKSLETNKANKIKNIISIGRLDQQKNQQLLINAFFKLSVKYPDIILKIYGEGILRDGLQNLINSLNLQDRVFLLGINMDINGALRDADLFVFPSLYEGFSNALCEAMAVGLPVIASNCSGNVDIIEHGMNGLLFNNNEIADLMNCMQLLLDDIGYANRLANQAKNIVNKFNELEVLKLWDQVIAL